jgi:hypothetical protein
MKPSSNNLSHHMKFHLFLSLAVIVPAYADLTQPQNTETDRAYLRARNNGMLPGAGDTTGSYNARVAAARAHDDSAAALNENTKQLNDLLAQANILTLQLNIGLAIPERKGDTSPTPVPLTTDEKISMRRELAILQDQITERRSAGQKLQNAVNASSDRSQQTPEMQWYTLRLKNGTKIRVSMPAGLYGQPVTIKRDGCTVHGFLY